MAAALLDRLAALYPDILVAGDKRAADLSDAPDAQFAFMHAYLNDFEAARKGSVDMRAMFITMRTKYPDLAVIGLLNYSVQQTFGK